MVYDFIEETKSVWCSIVRRLYRESAIFLESEHRRGAHTRVTAHRGRRRGCSANHAVSSLSCKVDGVWHVSIARVSQVRNFEIGNG